MNCSTVSVDFDEYSKTVSETNPKAREDHKCSECSRVIHRGETYEKFVGKMAGELFVNKTCTDCLSLRGEFFKEGWYYTQLWDSFVEHISDCGTDISESSISKLTPRARDRVCDEIQDRWSYEELYEEE